MRTSPSDIVIVGSGPIGASAAYHLAQAGAGRRVTLLTAEPADLSRATYRQAGGSIRWTWDDPLKRDLTTATATLVHQLLRQGVDLSSIENAYYLVARRQRIPALNINAAKLVEYFLSHAERGGVQIRRDTPVERIEAVPDGDLALVTPQGVVWARQVVLAVGPDLPRLVPGAPVTFMKRVLLVLDVPVVDPQQPHTVRPFRDGFLYTFVKRFDDGVRLLLGHEYVIAHTDHWKPENYLPQLLALGADEVLPDLRRAKVERVLWGFDATSKTPVFHESPGLLAVSCGSAVRSCVGIGREIVKRLTAT